LINDKTQAMKTEFSFTSADGMKIFCYRYLPETSPIGCIQIAHGMADHAKRYSHFAEYLCKAGFAVYSNDHRGHGRTGETAGIMGYFSDSDGWNKVVEDMLQLNNIIKTEHPSCPMILFGHSMGSFLSRTFITKYSDRLQGCILSGSATHPASVLLSGTAFARLRAFFLGKKNADQVLNKMSFGAFNKKIKNPRTDYDWVSHNPQIVDDYIRDKFCGFVCTTGFFIDLLRGLRYINNLGNIAMCRKDLPVYFFGGSDDPVGDFGTGVPAAAEKMKKAGMTDVTLKIYEGGRHEMLNETIREEVYADVLMQARRMCGLTQ
jgi:alpha-beta hydrolase superfamily lysophospholipase